MNPTRRGPPAVVFKGHSQLVLTVAFHKDNKRLASGGEDGRVKHWDLTMGLEILAMDGHQLASVARDGTLRVWDATPMGEGN